jgi:hypothetical protein
MMTTKELTDILAPHMTRGEAMRFAMAWLGKPLPNTTPEQVFNMIWGNPGANIALWTCDEPRYRELSRTTDLLRLQFVQEHISQQAGYKGNVCRDLWDHLNSDCGYDHDLHSCIFWSLPDPNSLVWQGAMLFIDPAIRRAIFPNIPCMELTDEPVPSGPQGHLSPHHFGSDYVTFAQAEANWTPALISKVYREVQTKHLRWQHPATA